MVEDTVDYRPEGPVEIGHFRLEERIGGGAFGTVWKAYDTALERTVAVKLPRGGGMGLAQTEQFLREARAAAHLRHANIVAVHEVGRKQDTAYLVMDYVAGPTLADQVAQGLWTPREAARLCAELADAVQYAHDCGVIHRDLKPSNIILDSERGPHITDFGLAKRTADDVTLTMDGQILGTPAYMSPEQARGDTSKIDGRTDVYSIGVILFEMLTGERPFRGSLRMLLSQVLDTEPPRPRDLNRHVPRDLQIICLKCLEKDPRRRYPTAGTLAEDLRRFLGGKTVSARPTPAIVRAQRWCRRNRVVAGMGGAIFAVLAVGLIATATQWLRAERNAEKEVQLRIQVETLTQELLQLAEQIRQLESTRAVTPVERSAGKSSVRLPQADSLSEFDLSLGASPRARPETQALSRAESKADVEPDRSDAAQQEADALRAEVNDRLRELESLAPGIAAQYRRFVQ